MTYRNAGPFAADLERALKARKIIPDEPWTYDLNNSFYLMINGPPHVFAQTDVTETGYKIMFSPDLRKKEAELRDVINQLREKYEGVPVDFDF